MSSNYTNYIKMQTTYLTKSLNLIMCAFHFSPIFPLFDQDLHQVPASTLCQFLANSVQNAKVLYIPCPLSSGTGIFIIWHYNTTNFFSL